MDCAIVSTLDATIGRDRENHKAKDLAARLSIEEQVSAFYHRSGLDGDDLLVRFGQLKQKTSQRGLSSAFLYPGGWKIIQ